MQQPSKPVLGREASSRAGAVGPLRSAYADDPEMAELVELFVSELPERLAALEAAWTSGDSQTLRRMAHQLKGAGAGYGFPVVSDAAGEVETAILARGSALPEAELKAVRAKVEALVALCRRAAASKGS